MAISFFSKIGSAEVDIYHYGCPPTPRQSTHGRPIMSMPNPPSDQLITVETPWYFYVCLGVAFVALGFVGLGMAYALTLYTIFLGGFLLIAGGAIQLIIGIFVKRGGAILMNLACGLLYLVAGVFAV